MFFRSVSVSSSFILRQNTAHFTTENQQQTPNPRQQLLIHIIHICSYSASFPLDFPRLLLYLSSHLTLLLDFVDRYSRFYLSPPLLLLLSLTLLFILECRSQERPPIDLVFDLPSSTNHSHHIPCYHDLTIRFNVLTIVTLHDTIQRLQSSRDRYPADTKPP